MTREARIGLVVGLGFVVVFGLILSELTGSDQGLAPLMTDNPSSSVGDEALTHAVPVVERLQDPSPRSRTTQHPPAAAIHRPAPARPAPHRQWRTYTVQAEDTLIGIARKHYGAGNEQYYTRILDVNRQTVADPSMLRVGQTLRIPPLPVGARTAAETSRSAAAAEPPPTGMDLRRGSRSGQLPAAAIRTRTQIQQRTHVVRADDTLTGIARTYYGNEGHDAVMKIYDANRRKLNGLDHLPIGMVLEIPR